MLAILRSIVATIVGYIVFAVSVYAIFRISGQAPHADASVSFMLMSIVSGMLVALAGGYVAGQVR